MSISDKTTVPIKDATYSAFSVVDLLTLLARRKWFLFRATLGTAILFGVVGFLIPPQFTATTTLLPPQQGGEGGAALLSQLGGLGGLGGISSTLGLKNSLDQYIFLMRSRSVEDAVIKRFNLLQEFKTTRMSDARQRLDLKVGIKADIKASIIELSVTDRNPAKAAELANGYIEEYRKLSSTLAVTEAAQRRLFFEQQLEGEKNKLATAEEDLKKTEQTTGLVEVDSQARALIQSTATLRAQIGAKQIQVNSMKTYAAEGNVSLMQAEQELAGLRAELARLGGNNDSNDAGLLAAKGQLPQASLEYVRRLRDVKYHETLFEMLARQFESAKLDEAKEGAVIQVVDPATPPDRKSYPPHALFVLIGGFFGLFLSAILVALREGLKTDLDFRARMSSLKQALLQKRDQPV